MDKLLILKQFQRLAVEQALESDEVRLFLLLVANSRNEGGGHISYQVVRDALGQELSPSGLFHACRRLSNCNLIKFVSHPEEGVPGDDTAILYKIMFTGKKT